PTAYSHARGASAHYGYGDTELGFKYRFIHEGEYLPQFAIFPQWNLPTGSGSRGLGNGREQVFLPLWAQKTFDGWKTFGGGGWWYNRGEENRDFVRLGWEVERDLNDTFTIGAEIFHETKESADVIGHTGINLGAYFNIDESHHLLFSAGRDLEGPNIF